MIVRSLSGGQQLTKPELALASPRNRLLCGRIGNEKKKRMIHHPRNPNLQKFIRGWTLALQQLEPFPLHHCPAHKLDEGMAELKLFLRLRMLRIGSTLDLPANQHPRLQIRPPHRLGLVL
jgi:hypothetical protein